MPHIAWGLLSTVTSLQKKSVFDTELYTIFSWSKTEANVQLLGLATWKEFNGNTFCTTERVPRKSCTTFLWQTKQKLLQRIAFFWPKSSYKVEQPQGNNNSTMNLCVPFIKVCQHNNPTVICGGYILIFSLFLL